MAWSLVSAGTLASGSNAASLAPAIPTGNVGDLLILQTQNFGGTGARTPQLPSGWTAIVSGTPYGTNGTSYHLAAYRIADGTEGSTVTVTMSGTGATGDTQLARVARFRSSLGRASAPRVVGTWTTNASADDIGPINGITVPTPTEGAVLHLIFAGKSNDWNGSPVLTNWTSTGTSESTTGNDAGMCLLYRLNTPSGATGNLTVTDNGSTASAGVGLGLMAAFVESAPLAAALAVVGTCSPDLTLPPSGNMVVTPLAATGTVAAALTATSPVIYGLSPHVSGSGTATTDQLSDTGETFVAGVLVDAEASSVSLPALSSGQETELEWTLEMVAGAPSATYEFRVINASTAAPLDGTAVVPTWQRAGATGDLGAITLAATTTCAATLTTAIPLVPTALAAVATTATVLTTGIRVAATLAAAATTAAVLTTAKPLAPVPLAATGTVSTALTTAIPLAPAPLGAAATCAADLTAAASTLAATLTAVATVSPALVATTTFAAALTATGTLAPTLTTAIPLAATMTASAACAGALTTAIPLAATCGATAVLATGLTTAIPLAAALGAAATTTGGLTTGIRLAAALGAAATCGAEVTVSTEMAATMTATAACVPTLVVVPTFAAALASTATLTPGLVTPVRLTAALSATATVVPALGTAIPLVPVALTAATTLAPVPLTTGISVAASLAGTAVTTAVLTTGVSVAAVLSATANVAPVLTTAIPLVPTVLTATAAVAAVLTTGVSVAAVLSATASVTPALTTAIRVAATLLATTTLTGTITTTPPQPTLVTAVGGYRVSVTVLGGYRISAVLTGGYRLTSLVEASDG